ncbi:MAG: hypothetical protein WA190_00185 [Usitatibacter sp.]
MDEFEQRKRNVLAPVYFEAGAALFDCQSFEYSVAYFLSLLARLGTQGLDPKHCRAILDDEEKKTAGQLIQMLRKHARVSDGIEQSLAEALTARNRLIHRYLMDNLERLPHAKEHAALVKEMEKLRSAVRLGIKRLDPFIRHLATELDGADFDAGIEEVKRAFLASTTSQ